MTDTDHSLRKQLLAIRDVVSYNSLMAIAIVLLNLTAAVFEGISVTFLIPIIESAQQAGTGTSPDSRLASIFIQAYDTLGIPFTLEYIILGVAIVMILRFTFGFLADWLMYILRTNYVRWLQETAFKKALDAQIPYYDNQGSDEILNAIVKQSTYAGLVIQRAVQFTKNTLTTLMYAAVTLYLAPVLTLITGVFLGVLAVLIREFFESGYSLGGRVAAANEAIQTEVQAGTQGIRDVKLFDMQDEIYERFESAVDQYAGSTIRLQRNQAGMDSLYQLVTVLSVFILIYAAVRYTPLTVAELGTFLFAVFRMAPRISALNNQLYEIQGALPHFVRTRDFIDELDEVREPLGEGESPPDVIKRVAFHDVSFSYDEETILDNVDFAVERGDFVAFVGPSGAGKSTIVSLLARMYEPDDGSITANGHNLQRFDLAEWRQRLAVVRQHPYIFDDTLEYNLTVGNREASADEIRRVCEISKVSEFLDSLPNGLQTELGDDGVRLSGGQRQRVAIARALLSDADLLVFDEATSDLDTSLETTVHESIVSEQTDKTLIVVAHRLSTVIDADRIYAMEDGCITESGHHGKLIEQDGTYASLYAAQS